MLNTLKAFWIRIRLELKGICSIHFQPNNDYSYLGPGCESCLLEIKTRKTQKQRAKQDRKDARVDALITQLNELHQKETQ